MRRARQSLRASPWRNQRGWQDGDASADPNACEPGVADGDPMAQSAWLGEDGDPSTGTHAIEPGRVSKARKKFSQENDDAMAKAEGPPNSLLPPWRSGSTPPIPPPTSSVPTTAASSATQIAEEVGHRTTPLSRDEEKEWAHLRGLSRRAVEREMGVTCPKSQRHGKRK